VIVHVDGRDLDATAIPIHDAGFRRKVFTQPETSWYSSMAELEVLVDESPMIELRFD
jgi:hypothetical protein